VDPRTRQLLHAGKEIHLSPKAFDLLVILIENRGRAMSRTALHEQLWPSTFVVDTNLASRIAEIRRALSDTSDDPLYIRTMHRFGYWFVGSVREDAAARPDRREAASPRWLLWDLRQVKLVEGENLIGRAPDADVWIDAPGVSRKHARITLVNQCATIEDLASKNGTFVAGKRITTPSVLNDGDQIRLGSVLLTFREPAAGDTTETSIPT
jgi:DNA-binding winged helix-turn-helix (wHTH) protein